MKQTRELRIRVGTTHEVSGVLQVPKQSIACYVMAHGAGAGMAHPFMAAVANALCKRGVATLRYQFPYMERGSKRPDTPALAHLTVRAAVSEAKRLLPAMPLFAGGKSFGGRMTSQAQAEAPLPGVQGLTFFGFPLHAAGKPSVTRAEHLSHIHLPMLFLLGTRDALADLSLLMATTDALGPLATVVRVEGGDHSFHVPARSGRTDAEALDTAVAAIAAWIAASN